VASSHIRTGGSSVRGIGPFMAWICLSFLTGCWPSCLARSWEREGMICALDKNNNYSETFVYTLTHTAYQRLACHVPPQVKLQLFNSCGQQRNRTAAMFESLYTQGHAREVPNTSTHEMSSNEVHGAQPFFRS
jgi:hypothetical protein